MQNKYKINVEAIKMAQEGFENDVPKCNIAKKLGVHRHTLNVWLQIGEYHEDTPFSEMDEYQWLCRCLYRSCTNARELHALAHIESGGIWAFAIGVNRMGV